MTLLQRVLDAPVDELEDLVDAVAASDDDAAKEILAMRLQTR